MSYFPETINAVLAGENVRCDFLVHFAFLTTASRVWMGHGRLRTNDGNDWQGLGQFASISGIESALGGVAPVATFGLSGVDPTLLLTALNSSSEVKGRDVTVFIQYASENSVLLDNPYAVYGGIMDVMRINAEGVKTRKIDVTAETAFARRGFTQWAYLSHADQQHLYPGDLGLTLISTMTTKSVKWPRF